MVFFVVVIVSGYYVFFVSVIKSREDVKSVNGITSLITFDSFDMPLKTKQQQYITTIYVVNDQIYRQWKCIPKTLIPNTKKLREF
jgi:hypothetical protein